MVTLVNAGPVSLMVSICSVCGNVTFVTSVIMKENLLLCLQNYEGGGDSGWGRVVERQMLLFSGKHLDSGEVPILPCFRIYCSFLLKRHNAVEMRLISSF